MSFEPQIRLRRLRQTEWMRRLVTEHHLHADDLIWPVFIDGREEEVSDVEAMPGVQRYGIKRLVKEVKAAYELGIPAVALFPKTPAELKDETGSEAFNPENLICSTIRAIKAEVPEIGIIADVALDPYTSHGQDGLVRDGIILNDETVAVLAKQAVTQAEAGCDVIAPSDMMDGRVEAIRAALDEAGYSHVTILSYAVKYASAFYGPFRDAVGSAGALKGDKKSYQMNPANRIEAFREAEMDIAEGADMLMVKPGMPYLDILRDLRETTDLPLFAYQVSGEYSMLQLAIEKGLLGRKSTILESLLAFKRAGATGIFTYFAPEVAAWLKA